MRPRMSLPGVQTSPTTEPVAAPAPQAMIDEGRIAATGVLSAPYVPNIDGLDQFEGECHMAALWPGDPVDFAGKRVAIIGSGSTGIQLLPLVAASAEHVCLLQRTPNYVLPSRNHPIEKESLRTLKANYPRLRKQILDHPFALPINPPGRTMRAASEISLSLSTT